MREIKFRVWDKDDNKIYKVDGFINNFPFIDWNYDNDFEEYSIQDHYIVKNGEVMQYTGIKDKNGKEIYEGDIVKIDFMDIFTIETNFTGIATFTDGSFMVENEDKQTAHFLFREIDELEVIGNIYENEDLLEK